MTDLKDLLYIERTRGNAHQVYKDVRMPTGDGMNKFRGMLRQPEFHVLFFFVCFVLICLPFVVFPGKNDTINMFDVDMFVYFFGVWGGMIILLFFMTKNFKSDDARRESGEKGGDSDV